MGITAGPDGNVWFTEGNVGRIGRITQLGVVTEFSAGISAVSGPHAIVAGPDGNLWFTEAGVSRIGRITPSGVFTEFYAGISSFSTPLGIAVGPDGNLWFTEHEGHRIGRITPSGVVTEFSSPALPWNIPGASPPARTATSGSPSRSATGSGGSPPTGVVTEFSAGITAGAQPGRHRGRSRRQPVVHRIQAATASGASRPPASSPSSAPASARRATLRNHAPGPTATCGSPNVGYRIGRITPAGVVTEFDHGVGPDGGSFWGIAAGPDGNLWFAVNSNVIGQITTGVHPPHLTVVEFYHASFDHYFMTPVPAEIALLDARTHPFEGWSRTGFSFNAYAPATTPALYVGVCRFFNIFFAPKSSHFSRRPAASDARRRWRCYRIGG